MVRKIMSPRIMSRISRALSSPLFVVCACAALLFLIHPNSFIEYWTSPFIQGWDGEGHATIGQYYSEHIFPATWGWVQNWYAGMPFPQFYPPLFYFVMAIIAHLFWFISYITLFKVVVIFMQLCIPAVLIFFVWKRTKNPYAIWVTGIASVLFASSYFEEIGNAGINIQSTLYTGMVTQLLGFLLFIFWLHFFLHIEHNKRSRVWAGLFLFLNFLSNAHETIVVFFVFVSVYIVSFSINARRLSGHLKEKKSSKVATVTSFAGMFIRHGTLYFLSGLIPLLLTAFWTIPLLHTYQYFVTETLKINAPLLVFIHDNFGMCLLFIVGLFIACRSKNRDLLIVSVASLVVFFFVYAAPFFIALGLPLHTLRWFGPIVFCLPIIAGCSFHELYKTNWVSKVHLRVQITFVATLLFVFCATGIYATETDEIGGYYHLFNQDRGQEVFDYVGAHGSTLGMTLTEGITSTFMPIMHIFDSRIGLVGGNALVAVFRESSINSVFFTPVRNTFSMNPEAWGFQSYLAFDHPFFDQPFANHLDRAEELGIQSFLIRSEDIKKKFTQDPRIAETADFGNWALFSFKKTLPKVTVLTDFPVLFYGQETFKDRPVDSYDWARFQEELLFSDSRLTFMYPSDQYIDTSLLAASSSSSAAVISSYNYYDLKKTYQEILDYSKTHIVVVVADENPLFWKLFAFAAETKKHPEYHITIINALHPTILGNDPLRHQLGLIINLLEASSSIPVKSSLSIASSTFTNSRVHVELTGTSTVPLPVLIKMSYFPTWKRTDGAPVYLGTPGFTLTYATSSFDLYFETPDYVFEGVIISLLTLLLGVGIAYWQLTAPAAIH